MPVIELIVDDKGTTKLFDTVSSRVNRFARDVETDMDRAGAAMQRGSERGERSLTAFAVRVDGAGRQSMIAMRSIGDVASLLGLEPLQVGINRAAMATDAIGDMSGALSMLNPLLLGVTAVGAGAALVFGEIDRQNKVMQEALRPSQELKTSLDELTGAHDALGQKIAVVFALTGAEADAFAEAARASDQVRDRLKEQADARERLIRLTKEWMGVRSNIQSLELTEGGTATEAYAQETQRLAELEAQMRTTGQAMADNTQGVREMIDALTDQGKGWAVMRQQALAYYADEERANQANWAVTHALWDARAASYKKAFDELTKMTDALKRANDAANSMLGGMVEKALAPTAVTPQDLEATAGGKYVDKWDEVRRRWEAIATGGGAEFSAEREMLDELGLSAEEAARRFKDLSLFADPKAMKMGLIDWGALTTDVEGQLDAMVGRLNVTQEAMARVWDNLAPEKKDALKKLGIASMDDATKALFGLQPSKLNIIQSPDFVPNLQAMRQAILDAVPPEMSTTVFVTYKTLQPGGGGGGENDTGGHPSGTVSSTAGAPGSPIGYMQHGGYGELDRDTLFYAHRGERYWFGGVDGETPFPGGEHNEINIHGANKSPRQIAWEVMNELKRRGR